MQQGRAPLAACQLYGHWVLSQMQLGSLLRFRLVPCLRASRWERYQQLAPLEIRAIYALGPINDASRQMYIRTNRKRRIPLKAV